MTYDREVGACYFVMPDGQCIDLRAESVRARDGRSVTVIEGGLDSKDGPLRPLAG